MTKELSYEDASAVMDIMSSTLGGTVKALARLAPIFDDTQVYQMTHKSVVSMMETPEGVALAQGLLALALAQRVRQHVEASGG